MFEHRGQRLLARRAYLHRQARHGLVAAVMVGVALAIGAGGYHVIEGQRWIDAVYSAAMILTGMGPAIEVKTDAGKLFATAYSLFSGVVFLTAASVLVAPALHRLLHRLHVEFEDEDQDDDDGPRGGRRGRGPGQTGPGTSSSTSRT